jgi:hypothetical protein
MLHNGNGKSSHKDKDVLHDVKKLVPYKNAYLLHEIENIDLNVQEKDDQVDEETKGANVSIGF